MKSSCSLPAMPPSWGTSPMPLSGKPEIPSWNELEPSANFTTEAVSHDDTYQPPIFKDISRRELQLRKLVKLPSSVLGQEFGHNAILDSGSGATSSFIKPDGGAQSTSQPTNKTVRMPNG